MNQKGCQFVPLFQGYVLSKEALERFITKALQDETGASCNTANDEGYEDVEIGKCLESVGVEAGDSRDLKGKGRFSPLSAETMVMPEKIDVHNWYWNGSYYPTEPGPDCCSDSAVSFHYISPGFMYVMEYLTYHLRPHGLDYKSKPKIQTVIEYR